VYNKICKINNNCTLVLGRLYHVKKTDLSHLSQSVVKQHSSMTMTEIGQLKSKAAGISLQKPSMNFKYEKCI